MGACLQLGPVRGRNVPVDDGAVGLGDLAVRDARRLHGIVDINAATQQQGTQNHSDKRLHGSSSVAADNAVPGGWFRGASMIRKSGSRFPKRSCSNIESGS